MAQRAKNVNEVTATVRVANFDNAVRMNNAQTVANVLASKYAGKDKAGQAVYNNVEIVIFMTAENGTKNGTGKKLSELIGQDILVTGSMGKITAFQKKDGSIGSQIQILANEIALPVMEEVPDAPAPAAPAPATAANNFI